MQVIVFASQKGGVGKTTLTANLGVAAEIAGDGPAVLIDTDPQGSLAAWWNAREAETPALAPTTSESSRRDHAYFRSAASATSATWPPTAIDSSGLSGACSTNSPPCAGRARVILRLVELEAKGRD